MVFLKNNNSSNRKEDCNASYNGIHRNKTVKSSYILKEVIGQGSWGVVRKCQHRQTKQVFACKTIHKSKVPSKEEEEMMHEEIANLYRVKGYNDHIVEVVDVYEDKKQIHIVTELISGGELYERVIQLAKTPQKRFKEQDAAWMIHNVLDAIRYLHDVAHCVHRDLKASNFLFADKDDPRSIKIIDLGLSMYNPPSEDEEEDNDNVNDDNSSSSTTSDDHHNNGQLFYGCVGTPYYVAPEVLTHDETGYTNKCDVWSIGVIAYLILSVSLPFQGKDERETVKMLMSSDVQANYLDSKWKDVDPLAIEFCKSLLQKDPAKRPSARQAMSHPWLVKHCGEPSFNAKKEARNELEVEFESLSPSCSLKGSISREESLSLRTRSTEASVPLMDILSKDDDDDNNGKIVRVVMAPLPEDGGRRNFLNKLFARRSD